jgi:hypothetical protein
MQHQNRSEREMHHVDEIDEIADVGQGDVAGTV